MDRFRALSKDDLPEGPSTVGVKRHVAFKGDDFTVLRSRLDPNTMSGWHHHGEYAVYGYIVSGSSRFDSGPGGKTSHLSGQGTSSSSRHSLCTETATPRRPSPKRSSSSFAVAALWS
jgi:hypothetical protein